MTASIWNPGSIVTTQVTASGTVREPTQTLGAGQTVISFSAITYVLGTDAIYVYLNGVLLANGADYTETSTSSITLTRGAVAGDSLTVMGVESLVDSTTQATAAPEVAIAAAVTTNIGAAASDFIRVTGSDTISSFGTVYQGPLFLRFTGSCTLTNSSTLICPGGVNLSMGPGSTCIATPKSTTSASDGWVISAVVQTSGGGGNTTTSDWGPTIKSFGALGNGTTDDTAAFVLAEADASPKIWLPAGIYIVNPGTTLRKTYWGYGKLKVTGGFKGQLYSNVNTATPLLSSPAAYAEGDISKVFMESWLIDAPRKSIDEYYFDSRTTPRFVQATIKNGHSGSSAKLTANCLIGATSCTVNAVSPEIVVGGQITIGDGAGQTTNRATVTSIVGNVINFTPAATTNALAANFQYVSVASRTMNPYQYVELDFQGGGDSYAHVSRIVVSNTNQQSGQTHFFRTATGGMYGGDMYGAENGVYLTGTETQYADTTVAGTKNIAVIDRVTNFARNSDTGSYGCLWIGNLQQSYGSQYVDAAYSLLGKFKSGLNTVLADFGASKAAISMAAGQKILFDSVSTSAQGDAQLYGNIAGTTRMGINTVSGALEIDVNGTAIFKANSTDVYTGTAKFRFGNDAYQAQAQKLYFDGNVGTPKNYIYDDATYLGVYYNASARILVNNGFVYIGNTGVEVQINQRLNLTGQAPTTAVGAAGPAPTPPAPVAYLPIKIDGNNYKIAFYNV